MQNFRVQDHQRGGGVNRRQKPPPPREGRNTTRTKP
jgi:hypothetical protein